LDKQPSSAPDSAAVKAGGQIDAYLKSESSGSIERWACAVYRHWPISDLIQVHCAVDAYVHRSGPIQDNGIHVRDQVNRQRRIGALTSNIGRTCHIRGTATVMISTAVLLRPRLALSTPTSVPSEDHCWIVVVAGGGTAEDRPC
jgi:hypothetical protein